MCLTACASPPEPRTEISVEIPLEGSIRDQIIGQAQFKSLRITGEITLTQDDRPLVEGASAVLYLEPPDRMRLRVYRMGIPVIDLLLRDSQMWSRPEADASAYSALVGGLLPALMWWQDMRTAELYLFEDRLMFVNREHRIWVDRKNLLPLFQEFGSPAGPVYVQYSSPYVFGNGEHYPSHIAVIASNYSGLITIRKLAVDDDLRPELFLWASD